MRTRMTAEELAGVLSRSLLRQCKENHTPEYYFYSQWYDDAKEIIKREWGATLEAAADRAINLLYPANAIYDCNLMSGIAREKRKAELRAAILRDEEN
jgi:hypothetical protein